MNVRWASAHPKQHCRLVTSLRVEFSRPGFRSIIRYAIFACPPSNPMFFESSSVRYCWALDVARCSPSGQRPSSDAPMPVRNSLRPRSVSISLWAHHHSTVHPARSVRSPTLRCGRSTRLCPSHGQPFFKLLITFAICTFDSLLCPSFCTSNLIFTCTAYCVAHSEQETRPSSAAS